jgi:hypothetical protein
MGPGVVMGFVASNPRVMGAHASKGFWKAAYWLCLGAVLLSGIVAVAANL